MDRWRALPNPLDWKVTSETRYLLRHRRDPEFEGLRPFFYQVEAIEIAIWLAEVAPHRSRTARLLERLRAVNEAATSPATAAGSDGSRRPSGWIPGRDGLASLPKGVSASGTGGRKPIPGAVRT